MSGPPGTAGGAAIRPARPGDLAALRALVAAEPGASPLPPDLAAYLADAGSFVAEEACAPVGFLLAQPLAYDGTRPLTLWVAALFVHPARRRGGVGTALCRALGAWAETEGAVGALAPRGDDPATRALWRRVGFAPHREELALWRFAQES